MLNKIYRKIQNKIIDYVFEVSKRPLSFIELLKINKIYDDKMKIEGNIPGLRLILWRVYLVFIILWNLVILPIVAITHALLAKLDCHLSILAAIVFTLLFFGTFTIFKEWLFEQVTLKLLKKEWRHHFEFFDYEKYHKTVANIYSEALEKGIAKSELRLFIFNNLSSK